MHILQFLKSHTQSEWLNRIRTIAHNITYFLMFEGIIIKTHTLNHFEVKSQPRWTVWSDRAGKWMMCKQKGGCMKRGTVSVVSLSHWGLRLPFWEIKCQYLLYKYTSLQCASHKTNCGVCCGVTLVSLKLMTVLVDNFIW